MPPRYTQTGRPIRIVTPLGEDVLLLERIVADEAVSKPFELVVELLSENKSVDPKTILQKEVTIEIDVPDHDTRYFNGVVRRFVQLGYSQGLALYRAEVVPTVWLLSLSKDCRIFQTMSAVDIVKEVFHDAGITDYRFALTGDPPVRDYCVQYRETNLDFVSRLMEAEGISYFFEHTERANTIVFVDAPSAVKPALVHHLSMLKTPQGEAEAVISALEVGSAVSSAKVTLVDYNDTVPRRLQTVVVGNGEPFGAAKSEVYDFPGMFGVNDDGERLARLQMEELEATASTVRGSTASPGLGSGQKITISDHWHGDVNMDYQLLSLHHEGTMGDYRSGGDEGFGFETTFVAIPATVKYRPPRVTPKAIVHGLQPALVVGPKQEEIYVDKYGRVKVQFFWDRKGGMDDKSSCWVRVSSTWAGKQWGFIQIPRIGQEVLIDFLEGDPDRPIITGRVYNGDMMPPYELPANGTQSGLKTRSSKTGEATEANELRFEDKKGSEEVYLHSQKNFNAKTENDETWNVLHDRTTTIKNDETKTVTDGNESTTISKGTRTITVEGDQSITIKTGKQSLVVKTGDMTTEVSTGNQSNTVKTGNMTTEVSMGNHSTTVKLGNVSLKASAGAIANEAMQSIELKVGGNSIKIDQTGITIKGIMVQIEGQAMTEVKSPMTTVKGDGMLTLKGGITMIN